MNTLQMIANPITTDIGAKYREGFDYARNLKLQDIALQQQQEERNIKLAELKTEAEDRAMKLAEKKAEEARIAAFENTLRTGDRAEIDMAIKTRAVRDPQAASQLSALFKGSDEQAYKGATFNLYAALQAPESDMGGYLDAAEAALPVGVPMKGIIAEAKVRLTPGQQKQELKGLLKLFQDAGYVDKPKTEAYTLGPNQARYEDNVLVAKGPVKPDSEGSGGGAKYAGTWYVKNPDGTQEVVVGALMPDGTLRTPTSVIGASKIISKTSGETPEEMQGRAIATAGGKEKATTEVQLEMTPKIKEAEYAVKIKNDPILAQNVQLTEQAVKVAETFREAATAATQDIRTLQLATEALDDGAITGPFIDKWTPTLRSATKRLENVQSKLGLNVIQSTTFGSLSEAELDFALASALPTGLKAKELKKWVAQTSRAKQKLANYYERASIFLSGTDPITGAPNTVADWTRKNREQVRLPAHPKYGDVTEGDIQDTMEANGLTREEVLNKLMGGAD